MRKFSDEELIVAYGSTKNVWRAAKILNVCGQSVQERLIKLGIDRNIRKFTKEDLDFLKSNYEIYVSQGNIKALAKLMNRTVPFLCRKARLLKLTNAHRKKSEEVKKNISIHSKNFIQIHGHPKGMLNKKHSKETLEILSKKSIDYQNSLSKEQIFSKTTKMLKTKLERYGTTDAGVHNRENSSWKSGWRIIGGIKKYYRSRWEANYARYLEFLKEHKEIKSWTHESKTFWFNKIKRGCRSYLPDFEVVLNNESIEYHEVKGWLDDKSKTKLKRMKKYYPSINLKLIDSKWFRENTKTLKNIIKEWEN
jgi:hypothetical protein